MPGLAKVIYIAGSGRSGSTLLERVLHSGPGLCAVGELHCLWRVGPAALTCSCGQGAGADGHWQRILDAAEFDATVLAELQALEARVCRTGFVARQGFSMARLRADPGVQRFLALQFRLFEAIADMTGARVVVDSSKAGPRGWLLACDERVSVVHLHRDPGDVILSWRGVKHDPGLGRAMKRMSLGAAALDWWKADRLTARLGRERPVVRVDYHALCADPQGTLARLRTALGLCEEDGPDWLDGQTVRPGAGYHSLNGNPDRFSAGPIRIAARQANWAGVGLAERGMVRGLAALVRTGGAGGAPSEPGMA